MEALGEALKRMASPKRLVKDPRTGEKRVEIIATDMTLDEAINALGAPRRVVRDPLTGEKRTEAVI
jgi:topoisomerase IA-like protein